ncbi:MAG: C39 family peptidase [Moraxellaceae bacterium]|nr:C39 family peptidase [Moraxellaceae bacterium]MBP9731648.1 C39 family peptidase [Moraxellaceae bacterium]
MFTVALGAALIYFAAVESFEVEDKAPATVYYDTPVDSRHASAFSISEPPIQVKPLAEQQFRGIVRQAYDYSCGSAALTTVLNGYLGRNFSERQVMDGLLKFGETDKIVQRRGFSLLDMKRLVTALGHPSGGYKGKFDDLKKLDHPAIVPIHYGGFKHFVVVKKYHEGRIFVADPALGNISFPEERFKQIWDNNVMFIVFPNGFKPHNALELVEDDMRYVDDQTINNIAMAQIPVWIKGQEDDLDRAGTTVRVLNADTNSATFNQPIDIQQRTYYRRK